MEMKKYKLGEIAEIEISSVDKKSKEGEIPVKLCNFVDVYHNWAITKDLSEKFMNATAKQSEIDIFKLRKGQVAFTKDSETRDDIGIPTYIADDFDNVILGYHTALATPDETKINGKYLNAFMNTRYIQKYFENNASGSGQRYTLSNDTLYNIPIIAPDLGTQKLIGNFFSNIDKKIALNARINANLERIAKRLYDYWFVQFDFPRSVGAEPCLHELCRTDDGKPRSDFHNEEGKPYKSSGGKMVWSEELKREIPEGWEIGNLYEIADYVNGLACQNFRPKENENWLPVIKIREMNEGITNDTEKVSANIPEKYKIKSGDILFSWSASLEVKIWNGGNGGLNQHIFKVVPKSYFSKEYVYQQLCRYVVKFQKQAEARKTTMGHITSDHISQSRILLPPKSIIDSFTQKTLSIFNYQLSIQQQSQKLSSLRDRLLPLLMNRQVSVR